MYGFTVMIRKIHSSYTHNSLKLFIRQWSKKLTFRSKLFRNHHCDYDYAPNDRAFYRDLIKMVVATKILRFLRVYHTCSYVICLYEFCTYAATIAAAHSWTNTFTRHQWPLSPLRVCVFTLVQNFCEEIYLVSCNCREDFSLSHLVLCRPSRGLSCIEPRSRSSRRIQTSKNSKLP